MDETAFQGCLETELGNAIQALQRRLPGADLEPDRLEQEACERARPYWDRGEPFPHNRRAFFGWLFGVALRLQLFTWLLQVREDVVRGIRPNCAQMRINPEDVVQEAWIRTQNYIDRHGERGHLPQSLGQTRNWFWEVARNTAIDNRRSENRRPTVALDPLESPPAPEPEDYSDLHHCIDRLSDEEKQVVRLWMTGLKPKAIARQLSQETRRIYTVFAQARDRLRRWLGNELVSEEVTQ